MNNARLWLVVNPTVGIPVFLGAVAIGSFANHVAIVTNTSWVGDFLSGEELGATAAAQATGEVTQPSAAPTTVYFDPSKVGTNESAVLVLEDGTQLNVVFKAPASENASLADASGTLSDRTPD